jgi:hypothetical protein
MPTVSQVAPRAGRGRPSPWPPELPLRPGRDGSSYGARLMVIRAAGSGQS